MTECEQLKLELPWLRGRVQTASADEFAAWSAEERMRFSREIHWCVEALTELDARIKAATQRA
jgi:hypothetical protein